MIGFKAFAFIFLCMPVGHAVMILINLGGKPLMVVGAVLMIVLGMALLVWTRYMKSSAWQSFYGAVAGIFLWTGAVEYGFKFGAEMLEVGTKNGTYGEYRLLEHTWSLILMVCIYLLFQEGVRCRFFVWLRQRLRLMRGKVIEGKVSNYGPRTAFEMITLLWFFYVLLLVAYDESLFGPRNLFTYLIFVGSLAATVYLLPRLLRIKEMGLALRYAIPTVIILWNTVEIMAKWGLFKEPWITLDLPIMLSIAAGFLISLFAIFRDRRKKELSP